MAADALGTLRNPGLSRHPAGERDDAPCHNPGLLSKDTGSSRHDAVLLSAPGAPIAMTPDC